jgi:hypothetical protein
MTGQLALDFERLMGQGPAIKRFHIDQMIAVLRGKGWRTAKDLGARKEADKRVLRAIAESSEGQIISGQKGYKLTIEATVTEISETAWLKSQGKKMIQRWLAIQKVAHPILAGARPE